MTAMGTISSVSSLRLNGAAGPARGLSDPGRAGTPVEDIVLTPLDGKAETDVRGDPAGHLTLSVQTKNPAGEAGSSQVEMVAGAGFEPATFRL